MSRTQQKKRKITTIEWSWVVALKRSEKGCIRKLLKKNLAGPKSTIPTVPFTTSDGSIQFECCSWCDLHPDRIDPGDESDEEGDEEDDEPDSAQTQQKKKPTNPGKHLATKRADVTLLEELTERIYIEIDDMWADGLGKAGGFMAGRDAIIPLNQVSKVADLLRRINDTSTVAQVRERLTMVPDLVVRNRLIAMAQAKLVVWDAAWEEGISDRRSARATETIARNQWIAANPGKAVPTGMGGRKEVSSR
jgi:hypothetical protein